MLKRVAIVGADFLSSSRPPALRIRFFVQHLPEYGWQPIVVTTDPKYHEWAADPENDRLLSESLQVIRTAALPVGLTRKVGIGDIGIRSLSYHWRTLVKLCKEQAIDLVFIPVPPYVTMILGRLIHSRLGIPYVIDYIDPWVTEEYWKLPRKQRPPKWALGYALSRVVEPIALKHVAHIVGVSEGTTDSVISRYPWLTQADVTEIPYGGDPADFDYIRRRPRRNHIFDPKDGFLHITYVGAYVPTMQATIRTLFEAVRLGLKRKPQLFQRMRLHFVGTNYAPNATGQCRILPFAREIKVDNLISEHPNRIPYLDALQVMLDSHALLIVGSDAPHYTASKIFPYILARRALLAVFHEASSVVRILRETQAGQIITFNSEQVPMAQAERISTCLEKVLLLSQKYQPPTRWEAFEPYTTQAMAARLAQVFNRVSNKKPEHL